MQINEIVQLTARALELLDAAGLGTSAAACHLQMALDTMSDHADLSLDEQTLVAA
jgi:hypothetical protein